MTPHPQSPPPSETVYPPSRLFAAAMRQLIASSEIAVTTALEAFNEARGSGQSPEIISDLKQKMERLHLEHLHNRRACYAIDANLLSLACPTVYQSFRRHLS